MRKMKTFMVPKRREKGSSAEQIAEVVYEAATDNKDQVTYVAGADAKELSTAIRSRWPRSNLCGAPGSAFLLYGIRDAASPQEHSCSGASHTQFLSESALMLGIDSTKGLGVAESGNRSFVANIAARYGPRLRRFLSVRLRNAADVPDLAQEVFLRLLRVEGCESFAVRRPIFLRLPVT